jgi:hypothetical protein
MNSEAWVDSPLALIAGVFEVSPWPTRSVLRGMGWVSGARRKPWQDKPKGRLDGAWLARHSIGLRSHRACSVVNLILQALSAIPAWPGTG